MKEAMPAHLIGHSYGAFVALYYAYNHPETVRSLVLVEPYVPSLIVEDPQNRREILALLLRKPSVALAARNFLNKSLNPALKYLDQGNEEKAVEVFLDGVQGKPNAISQLTDPIKSMMVNNAGTIKELTLKPPHFTNKEAKAISLPTLLISGENTTKALHAIAEEVSKNIPKIQVTKIPNSAHFPHFENPEATNAAITKFLSMQTS
jgi:pimeloyl-ACP methyl ester carboxylesterase